MSKKLAIIGASGHGKVIADIALKNGSEIVGFAEVNVAVKEIAGDPVLGTVSEIPSYQTECEFLCAIGKNRTREMIAEQYAVTWAKLNHTSAHIGLDVQIEVGTVVMAIADINPTARIGKQSITNTGAVIEHDNFRQNYVHLSPNAGVAGTVHIGERVHVGGGACVKNNTNNTPDVTGGAGAAGVKDITEAGVSGGEPAGRMR